MHSKLRLADLQRGFKSPAKLMNVKVPESVSDGIARIARETGSTKTDVVVALFNEGLDAAAEKLRGWKPRKVELPVPKRMCTVPACGKAHVAKGYCITHYQALLRGKLPRKG